MSVERMPVISKKILQSFFYIFFSSILVSCVSRIDFTQIESSSGTSSSGGSSSSSSNTISYIGTLTSTVQPVYPTTGANWNDYVEYTSTSFDQYNQTDTACTGGVSGHYYQSCIHGGEKLKVETPLTSYTGLSGQDNLGAFDWECAVDGGVAVFYTKGLKSSKGLRDIIDATEFKDNYFEVLQSSTVIYDTTPEKWWSNTFTDLPDSSGATEILTSTGTIYTLTSSASSRGYNIASDKISIVTLNNSQLNHLNTGNCTRDSGMFGTNNITTTICSGSRSYLWIEAKTDGQGNNYSIYLHSVNQSRLNDLDIVEFNYAVTSTNSQRILITNSNLHNANNGILLNNATYNIIRDVRVTNMLRGLEIVDNSNYNIFDNLILSHGRHGIDMENSKYNHFNRLITTNNYDMGITSYYQSGSNTIGFLTTVNNEDRGMVISDLLGGNHYYQLFSANNGDHGLYFNTANSTAAALVAYSNGSTGINVNKDNHYFRSGIKVGANGTDCDDNGRSNVELDGACNYNVGTASAAETAIDASSTLFGKITSDDSANSLDVTGAATSTDLANSANYAAWINFDNFYRAWGPQGSAFPNADNQSNCSSETCHIWDYRFNSGDSVATGANGTFTAGSACPSSIAGNNPDNYIDGANGTHLVSAFEIIGDYIGNDDTLCESNEACIFAPNIGAYQGEGDYESNGTCTFTDGVISGVTMYGYPTTSATP